MSLDIQSLASLFELSRDAVIGTESDDVVRFANPAARELLGAEPGRPAVKYLPAEIVKEPSECFTAAAVFKRKSMDVCVTRKDGISLYSLPRTVQTNAPDAMHESAAAEMGSFLMTQRLALDKLADRLIQEPDDALTPYMAVLYKNYYRAKRLHDHLAASIALRKENVRFEPRLIALEEVFGSACDTVRRLLSENDASLVFEAPEESCVIRGDPQLLEMLLFNLLSNSLLHAFGGGIVRVSLTKEEKRCILAVDDTGTGIPSERMSGLMSDLPERDTTDPGAGVGLGLSIVRGISTLHGGTLLLESRRDKGTRMRVSFPFPAPGEISDLHEASLLVRPDGMDRALTELSGVFDKSVYTARLFD